MLCNGRVTYPVVEELYCDHVQGNASCRRSQGPLDQQLTVVVQQQRQESLLEAGLKQQLQQECGDLQSGR